MDLEPNATPEAIDRALVALWRPDLDLSDRHPDYVRGRLDHEIERRSLDVQA